MMITLVMVLAMWLRVTCAMYVFTHLYEEYRLQIVVDIITLYS